MSRLFYSGKHWDYFVVDDGTMDTVLEINGIEHRLSHDAEIIRRHKTGKHIYEPYAVDLIYWVKEIIETDSRYWDD